MDTPDTTASEVGSGGVFCDAPGVETFSKCLEVGHPDTVSKASVDDVCTSETRPEVSLPLRPDTDIDVDVTSVVGAEVVEYEVDASKAWLEVSMPVVGA